VRKEQSFASQSGDEARHDAAEDLSEPTDSVCPRDDGLFDGLAWRCTDVKVLLMNCPVLNDLLPRGALPTKPGSYLWQGTLVEESDPQNGHVQTRYWIGGVLPVTEADVTTIFTKFGDRASASLILMAAFRAASKLEELNP